RAAALALQGVQPSVKNRALELMAVSFDRERERIKSENARDLEAGRANGLTDAMIDRLRLSDKGIDGLIRAVREIAALPEPVGEIIEQTVRPNGLRIGRMRA